jgi:MFS family permease
MKTLHGSIVWFIATLFVVYAFCLNTASAVFSSAIQTSLHASNVGVSIATGAFILGFAFMQIPGGYLLDKFNPRFVVGSGVLLLALGNILISYANNLTIYALSNFVQGVGAAFAFIAAAVLISQWFSAKVFPIMFGLTQTLSCVLAGIIHYYFTVILAEHPWNDIYRCLAICGAILLVLVLLLVSSPAKFKHATNISLKHSLGLVFKNKQIVICSIAAATSFGVLLAYAGLWYLRVQTFYSVDKLQAVVISGIMFAGIGIGTPFLGWMSNLLKSRVMVIHLTLCLGIIMLLMGIYLPHFQIHSLIITQTISFFIGFFLSGSMLFYTIVNEISTNETRGVAISLVNTAVFLFNTLMLFIPYLFLTVFSTNFYTYLWILPVFIIISLMLLYFVKDTSP